MGKCDVCNSTDVVQKLVHKAHQVEYYKLVEYDHETEGGLRAYPTWEYVTEDSCGEDEGFYCYEHQLEVSEE